MTFLPLVSLRRPGGSGNRGGVSELCLLPLPTGERRERGRSALGPGDCGDPARPGQVKLRHQVHTHPSTLPQARLRYRPASGLTGKPGLSVVMPFFPWAVPGAWWGGAWPSSAMTLTSGTTLSFATC